MRNKKMIILFLIALSVIALKTKVIFAQNEIQIQESEAEEPTPTPIPTELDDTFLPEDAITLDKVTDPLDKLEKYGVTVQIDAPEEAILAVALPDVYILPNSPFYLLVKFWESLTLLWADTPEEKAYLLFEYAEKRLAETLKLIKKEDDSAALTNIDRYKGQLSQAINTLQEVSDLDKREQQFNRLEEQVWYQRALARVLHAEGLSDLFTETSEDFSTVIEQRGGIELKNIQ